MPRRGREEETRRRAEQSVTSDDATGWFDGLYAAAARGEAVVPWDREAPHPVLVRWTERHRPAGAGKRAVVVGCGLGDDAEHVAALGFDTVAFDVSPTAVEGARRRFPGSRVEYRVADLLRLPQEWARAFDLVVEVLTVQSLPLRLRKKAIAAVRGLVAPGGTLVVVANARDSEAPPPGPPWPLSRRELESFAGDGLEAVRIESFEDPEVPRRWLAELSRRASASSPGSRPAT